MEENSGFRKRTVNGDALQLMAEFLRIFVLEAAARGVSQAQAEDLDVVDVDQLEKVLPQLSWTSRVPLLWPARSSESTQHQHPAPELSSFQRMDRKIPAAVTLPSCCL
ncbi:Centromere protein X [Apodemus speciosus]|uniref:Centromere protein X n=1 Tax=Apodemus speciosus TaxID=105296 RepID=A0ABQ0FD56_APOSI